MLGATIGDLEPGDVFEPVTYILTSFMCAEYAHGMEETSEYFYGPTPEFGRQLRPPTMIHADKMRLLERNCTLERRLSGVVAKDARIHYEYHAQHHSPAYVGDELVVSGEITEKYVRRGREYIRYRLVVSTSDGRLVTTYTDRTLLRFLPEEEQR